MTGIGAHVEQGSPVTPYIRSGAWPITKSCCCRALRAGRLFLWDVLLVQPSFSTAHPIPCTLDADGVGVCSGSGVLREHRPLWNQIVLQIAPQRHHQLTGKGDDANSA